MVAAMCVGWGYVIATWRHKKAMKAAGQMEGAAVAPLPMQGKWGRSAFLRTSAWTIALLVGGMGSLLVIPDANAALSDVLRGVFSAELSGYITDVMDDPDNELRIWGNMILGFCFMVVIVTEVAIFVFEGLQPLRLVEAFVFVCATLAIWTGYDYFTEAIWGVGVGVSGGLQRGLVGNTDNFFMSQWLVSAVDAVNLEELGIFDGVKAIMYMGSWMVASFILDFVAWLAAIWADFGYALAKVIGLCFIPFLMLPSTRGFFDAWFKLLVGFVILKIILTATMVIACLSLKSILADLGVRFTAGYTALPAPVSVPIDEFYKLFDASAMLLVSILFVLSSFVFAGALAGGTSNLSGGLGKAAGLAKNSLLKAM